MGRRLKLIIILTSLISYSIYAQVSTFQDSTNTYNNSVTKPSNPFFSYSKLHFSMNFGTGYIGGSSLYSGVFTSLSPNINYQVTSRLNIQTGVTLASGLNNNFQSSNPASQTSSFQRPNQFFLYASGQYLLTKNLSLTGSVYKTASTNNSEKFNPLFSDFKGMNIGIDYKITEHLSFGTSFNVSNNPYNLIKQNEMVPYSLFHNPNSW